MITFLLAATAYALIGTLTGVRAYLLLKARSDAAYTQSVAEYRREYPASAAGRLPPRDDWSPQNATLVAILWPVGIWVLLAIALITRTERAQAIQRENTAEQERYLAAAREELKDL